MDDPALLHRVRCVADLGPKEVVDEQVSLHRRRTLALQNEDRAQAERLDLGMVLELARLARRLSC